MPSESNDTAISSSRVMTKPITVARPTSLRRFAREEYTLAPSIPMNTQTVTSIVVLTCVSIDPSFTSPQKVKVNVSKLNAIATNTMKISKGMTLARVTTAFKTTAPRMPFNTNACTVQSSVDAPTIAAAVLPSPNTGKKYPKAPNAATRYPTLPIQALTQ